MYTVWIITEFNNKILLPKKYLGWSILLNDIFNSKWINLVRVYYDNFDDKNNAFTKYRKIVDNSFSLIENLVKPDYLWKRISVWNNYLYKRFHNYKISPTKNIYSIAADKFEMSLYLKDYQPNTCLLEYFFQDDSLQEMFSEKILIKPIRSNWGRWIQVFNKYDLLLKEKLFDWISRLYIVQEFKDFSKWYNEMIKWIHDVRLVFFGKEFVDCSVRNPAEWDFRSNIWSGWTWFDLEIDNIPKELFEISKKIHIILWICDDDIFSLDFAFCKSENRWYILEINASPWILLLDNDNWLQSKYFEKLADFFISRINSN